MLRTCVRSPLSFMLVKWALLISPSRLLRLLLQPRNLRPHPPESHRRLERGPQESQLRRIQDLLDTVHWSGARRAQEAPYQVAEG